MKKDTNNFYAAKRRTTISNLIFDIIISLYTKFSNGEDLIFLIGIKYYIVYEKYL